MAGENFDTQTPGAQAPESILNAAARLLPEAKELVRIPGPSGEADDFIAHLVVPKGFQSIQIDSERLLPSPRRAKGTMHLFDLASFVAYVSQFKTVATAVWCNFDAEKSTLAFTAIFDDNSADEPGWREHRAVFEPKLSPEWKMWIGKNKQVQNQVDFAEFIEANGDDIASQPGMPTSLEMLTMATEFVARQDQLLKSTVRLQSGGVNLQYVADPDKGTVEQMKLFEKFTLGLPVFAFGSSYPLVARLRYRPRDGRVTFFYELVRPDAVHHTAALELIASVQSSVGEVPVRIGTP